MYRLKAMRPVAALGCAGIETGIAPRPVTLDGLCVGLVRNRKRGGDATLGQVGTMLRERFADKKRTTHQGRIPTPSRTLDPLAEGCDVVVGYSSDWGRCASRVFCLREWAW